MSPRDDLDAAKEPVYGPTSGQVSGWLGIGGALAIAIISVSHGLSHVDVVLALAMLFTATLIWAFMVRPRVVLGSEELVLRNAVVDYWVPYAAIRRIVVRSVTQVWVDERRLVGIGVGRGRKTMMTSRAGQPRARMFGARAYETPSEQTRRRRGLDLSQLADLLEEQVMRRANDASVQPGSSTGPGVRRVAAKPEIAALAVTLAALVLAVLL